MVANVEQNLEGAKTIVIGHAGPSEVAAIRAAHAGRKIVDLQGVGELESLPGADYEGICW